MATAFADEAIRIHRDAQLSDALIAEAVGAKPSTVRDWLNGRTSPTGTRARRLADLAEITDRLSRIVDPRYVSVWLVKPVAALAERRPVEAIAAGEGQDVARIVSALESPGAS